MVPIAEYWHPDTTGQAPEQTGLPLVVVQATESPVECLAERFAQPNHVGDGGLSGSVLSGVVRASAVTYSRFVSDKT